MKKKKEGFLKENYKESFNYIKDSRNFIYSIIIVFLLFFFIGFFAKAPAILEEKILDFIKDLLTKTDGMPTSELIGFILLNNVQNSFIGVIFGVFLGIFPIISTIVNGYLLGFVAEKTVQEQGMLILWKILPHGVFELPALFISLGLGLKLGTFIFEKKKFKSLTIYILKSIKAFFFVVIPLLTIAAIIEGILISFF